ATIWTQVASAGTLESAISARPALSSAEPPPGSGTPTQPAVIAATAAATAHEPETVSLRNVRRTVIVSALIRPPFDWGRSLRRAIHSGKAEIRQLCRRNLASC